MSQAPPASLASSTEPPHAQGYHDITTHTRRHAQLTSAAAFVAAYAAALPPSAAAARPAPEAVLLALHRDFVAQDALCHAWNGQDVSEAIGEAAHDRWWEIFEAAQEMPARTLAGPRAKADIALKGLELVADSQSPANDLARAVLGELAA